MLEQLIAGFGAALTLPNVAFIAAGMRLHFLSGLTKAVHRVALYPPFF